MRVARGDRAIMESHLADAIEVLVLRSTRSLSADRSPKDPIAAAEQSLFSTNQTTEETMSAIKLHVIKPSVNNMTARVFVRAAGLDFIEDDVYGKTRSEEFVAKNPSFLTPMVETDDLPKGVMWESCAIMQYLCNKHGLESFYPTEPAARAMVDSAMFYVVGTLYPLSSARHLSGARLSAISGEVGASDAERRGQSGRAEGRDRGTSPEPLSVFQTFYLLGQAVHRRRRPSIADIRLAATLEFLAAIDYDLPALGEANIVAAMEKALGAAYSEPAADVRGYIGWVKSKA